MPLRSAEAESKSIELLPAKLSDLITDTLATLPSLPVSEAKAGEELSPYLRYFREWLLAVQSSLPATESPAKQLTIKAITALRSQPEREPLTTGLNILKELITEANFYPDALLIRLMLRWFIAHEIGRTDSWFGSDKNNLFQHFQSAITKTPLPLNETIITAWLVSLTDLCNLQRKDSVFNPARPHSATDLQTFLSVIFPACLLDSADGRAQIEFKKKRYSLTATKELTLPGYGIFAFTPSSPEGSEPEPLLLLLPQKPEAILNNVEAEHNYLTTAADLGAFYSTRNPLTALNRLRGACYSAEGKLIGYVVKHATGCLLPDYLKANFTNPEFTNDHRVAIITAALAALYDHMLKHDDRMPDATRPVRLGEMIFNPSTGKVQLIYAPPSDKNGNSFKLHREYMEPLICAIIPGFSGSGPSQGESLKSTIEYSKYFDVQEVLESLQGTCRYKRVTFPPMAAPPTLADPGAGAATLLVGACATGSAAGSAVGSTSSAVGSSV